MYFHRNIFPDVSRYVNITSTLVFTVVFGIHLNFLIVLPIQLKISRTNVFFYFSHLASGAQFIQAKVKFNLFYVTEFFL